MAVGQPQVRLLDSLVKVDPQRGPDSVAPSPTLVLCRGETGSFQVAVTAGDRPLAWLDLSPFELHGEDGAIPVRLEQLYREHFVQVDQPSGNLVREPRAWPDALLPLRYVGHPGLAAGRTAVFWVDVAVPRRASPGVYTARPEVLLAGEPHELDLTVTVVDIALPVERHLQANAAVYFADVLLNYANEHWSPRSETWTYDTPQYVRIREAIYELLLEHRLCAYDLPVRPGTPAAARWMTDPRVHSIRLPWLDDQGSAALRATVDQARALGVSAKLYYYAADEPPPPAYPGVIAAAEALHAAAPGVPFVATVAPVPELAEAVDIWCPNFANYLGPGYLDFAALAAERAAGKGTWWYTCCVPLAPYPTWLVDDDAVAPRASVWAMAKYGLTGFVYSMAHGWSPDPYASVASFNQTNGDGLLLYPGQPFGTDQPLPSIRLKLLREGLQDYELLRLLALERDAAARRRGVEPRGWVRSQQLAGELVSRAYRFSREPARLHAVRREAINELLAARQSDLVLELGETLAGVVRPGTALLADGDPVLVSGDGRWSRAIADEPRVGLSVGEPPLRLDLTTRNLWPAITADPPSAAGAVSPATLALETAAASDLWSVAQPVMLANAAEVRFAVDPEALWVAVDGADSAGVVLDPGRTHETVYTFLFDGEPHRAIRRTIHGRAPDYAPEWSCLKVGRRLLARLPKAALGVAELSGSWGATALATVNGQRSFWFDHHGDLRELPELVLSRELP